MSEFQKAVMAARNETTRERNGGGAEIVSGGGNCEEAAQSSDLMDLKRDLKNRGFSDAEIAAVFNKYQLEVR